MGIDTKNRRKKEAEEIKQIDNFSFQDRGFPGHLNPCRQNV